MTPVYFTPDRRWTLPPLILHPFSDANSPGRLMQSSRASLMLQGLLPNEEFSVEQLHQMICDGRVCEIRMLFYVGKDLLRWIDQCVEMVDREDTLRGAGIEMQTFASFLTEDTPETMKQKLSGWGVNDYRSIFVRGIGMNAVFSEVPDPERLTSEFIRTYHVYADRMYECWLNGRSFTRIRAKDFSVELYASGEYSRMLERQWQDEEG
jgi:hypothetical protein